jgi:hypothetical protein
MLFKRFAYGERGEGVFRFFHQVVSDPPNGVWVLVSLLRLGVFLSRTPATRMLVTGRSIQVSWSPIYLPSSKATSPRPMAIRP